MFNRVVVFATIVCLGSAIVEAQAPSGPAHPRIRITSAQVYEVPSPVRAQTAAGDIRALVSRGQKVLITDDGGRQFSGRVDALTVDGLELLVDGRKTSVRYLDVVRIEHPTDTLANGALVGFGVGAALGVAVVVSARSDCPGRSLGFQCPRQSAGADAAGAALLGGLGAAIGVGVDALIHHDRQIYQRGGRVSAVSPAVGRGAYGVVASVRW